MVLWNHNGQGFAETGFTEVRTPAPWEASWACRGAGHFRPPRGGVGFWDGWCCSTHPGADGAGAPKMAILNGNLAGLAPTGVQSRPQGTPHRTRPRPTGLVKRSRLGFFLYQPRGREGCLVGRLPTAANFPLKMADLQHCPPPPPPEGVRNAA